MSTARDREAAMFERCARVAADFESSLAPVDGREANVFRVAAMVIQSRFPEEAKNLMAAAELYYAHFPLERAPAADVIHHGDVISLPRLRDGLTQVLKGKLLSKRF